MNLQLTKEVVIRGVHHLENHEMSAQENRALYGLCYGKHGHHYKVRVTIEAPLDPKTGFVFSRDIFDQILQTILVERLDGNDLNKIFPNTAGEALAMELFDWLAPVLPPGALKAVGIQETRKNYFEFVSRRRSVHPGL